MRQQRSTASRASSTVYTAFGEPTPDIAGSPVGLDGIYGYTGHAWEPDLDQYQARARWYDPALGRFTGEDPKQATNLYLYVHILPLDLVDPDGESATSKAASCLAPAVMMFAPVTVSDAAKPLEDIVKSCAKIQERRRVMKEIAEGGAKAARLSMKSTAAHLR